MTFYQRLSRRVAALVAALALIAVTLGPACARAIEPPEVAGTAAILVDADTGKVLFESNADESRYPASLTKIMTALVVLENADLDQEVTFEQADFDELPADSSIAGYKVGETATVRDLLHGLLMASGNETSYALARATAGSVDAFVDMMNDRATELGCTGTHFANPCGLHDDDHYTTARDLITITTEAMKNETFAKIVSTETYELSATNLQAAREIENSNLLMNPQSKAFFSPAIGVKTGNTHEAGRCLVGAATQDGVTLYAAVLGCDNSTKTSAALAVRTLFEWAYDNYALTPVATEGEALTTSAVKNAANGEEVEVAPASTLSALLPVDVDPSAIEASYDMPADLAAPIAQGDDLGTATFTYDGETLGQVSLVAANDVSIDPVALAASILISIVTSPVFIGIVVVLVVVIAVSSVRAARTSRRRHTRMATPRQASLRQPYAGQRYRTPSGGYNRPRYQSGGHRTASRSRRDRNGGYRR